jgi:hypothetical protein
LRHGCDTEGFCAKLGMDVAFPIWAAGIFRSVVDWIVPISGEEQRLKEEMKRMEYEPLLPVEKELIRIKIGLGVILLFVFVWIRFTFFPGTHQELPKGGVGRPGEPNIYTIQEISQPGGPPLLRPGSSGFFL